MSSLTNQNLILIEGAATYERILADVRELETDEAIHHILDFVKIYPEFAPAHNDLAVLFYQAGNSLKSLAYYEKAHKLDPGNITYRKNLADFYFVELGWAGDAVRTYLDILKDNPFDIEALNALGNISLHLGRKAQARQYFSRTLQLDGDNAEAKQALQQLPPPVELPSDQRQISNSTRPSTQVPEPVACVNQDDSLFQQVSCGAPLGADELYQQATYYISTDNLDKAVAQFESLLSEHPDYAAAHNDLGVLYQKTGEIQKSREHHEAAVSLQPDNDIFQKNLADLLCTGFEAFEEALAIYVRLLAKNQCDVETLRAIAHICILVGQQADATHFLELILAMKPWDQDARATIRSLNATTSQ